MKAQTRKILNAVVEMPAEDQLEVVEELMVALEGEPEALVDEFWRAEVQGRSAEVETGTEKTVPWSTVKRRGAAKVRGET